jgi:CheY-like chemotaxis protein
MYAPGPILVVDDTAPFRELVRTTLAPRGYRVSGAANGREALARLQAAVEPHIVLLDIVMPVLDGIGLWREMQADPEVSAAGHCIILMSSPGRLSQPDVPQTHGRLAKPFSRQELIAAVEAVHLR